MQAQHAQEPLEQKTWQLADANNDNEGYLYYCVLCDEALVLSKQPIDPLKVRLVFEQKCPGCGFELDKVLGCRASNLPRKARLLTSLKCKDPEILGEPYERFQSKTDMGSMLPGDSTARLTLGIEHVDGVLVLKRGQFISLLGDSAHSLSLLYVVRSILPAPAGLQGDVVFIDGGNIFDIYTISRHAISLGLESEMIHERIHLSRAFTHHQLYSLIVEKLSSAIDEYNAKLAVVSDITALFCDPDVREKREANDMLNKSLRFLGNLAERKNIIIIATNIKTRNRAMEEALIHAPHVSARLKDRGAFTQLTVTRHPFLPEKEDEVVTLDNQTIVKYLTRSALPSNGEA
jgi:Rad51